MEGKSAMFQAATQVTTLIGLAAFLVACTFWYLAKKLKFKIDAAGQIKDEGKKIAVLRGDGFLPANWQSIEKKDAIRLAELQQNHKYRMFKTIAITSLLVLIISVIAFGGAVFIGSNSDCNSVGSGNVEISCNNN